MDAMILSSNYTTISVDLCRFSVENIPLYDSADDEPTSINKDILLSSHGMVTEYSSISTVQSTENPGNAGTNEFAPIIVDELTASSNVLAPMNIEPLTASSNEFTPMTIEPLNAMPMVAHVVENGSTEYMYKAPMIMTFLRIQCPKLQIMRIKLDLKTTATIQRWSL